MCSSDLLRCPGDKAPGEIYRNVRVAVSYGYNAGIGGKLSAPTSSTSFSFLRKERNSEYEKLTPVIADTFAYYQFPGNSGYFENGINSVYYLWSYAKVNLGRYGAHVRSMNLSFFDGHVDTAKKLY